MSYTKEERAEEMENELMEDKIREHSNEIDDGDFETWKGENVDDLTDNFIEENEKDFKDYCRGLISQFIEDNEGEFNDYCKGCWNEYNARLI